ncbi:AAA family ATPase [Mycetocola zhadangensis]|uniref:AAA family ATPase n=1 Tax=Mycetocola zhadangensis TaxID=1164595 RepID=UPI003A4E6020
MTDEPRPRAAARKSPVLYGRARQLSAIARAAAAVEKHKAQFVLIEGESGFGKTALLREGMKSLPNWPRHLAVGDAYERSLPFGVLNQLLAPFDQSQLSPILANGIDPTVSTLRVGAELLALTDASEGATIIAIDDAQWIDEQSARALWFVGRRSLHDRLLILIAARPANTDFLNHIRRLVVDGERGIRLEVAGLTPENVVELASERSGLRLPRLTAQRLADATAGNALHVLAMLEYAATNPDPVVEIERRLGDGILPLAPGYDAITRESLDRLGAPAHTLIHLLAVLDGRVTVHQLSAAAAYLGTPMVDDAIDEAVRSGLVDASDKDGQLELRLHHQRIGDAVLAQLSIRERQELHRAAAQVVGGDRGLSHRVRASTGPDDELAGLLEREAKEAIRHHEPERSVRYSLWAASLSSSPVDWQRRLVRAGLASVATRRFGLLVRAIPEIINLPVGVERDLLIGSAAIAMDDIQLARTSLLRAASGTRDTLWEAAIVAVASEVLATLEIERRRFDVALRACGSALSAIDAVHAHPDFDFDILEGVDLSELRGTALTWKALARWRSGEDDDIAADLSEHLAEAATTGFRSHHAVMLVVRGAIRRQEGRLDEAITDLEEGITLADVLRPSIAPYGRIELALAQFRQGRWDEAATTATIAVSLADDFGGAWTHGASHAVAALVPAARGERETVEAFLDEATSTLPGSDKSLLMLVDAVAARAAGDRPSVIRIARLALAMEPPRAQIEHTWWQELLDEAMRPPHPTTKPSVRDPLSVLSGREREVANLAAQGLTNREVAQRLFVTVKGVEYHMGNVLAKLHLTSRRGIRHLLDGHDPSHVSDPHRDSTRDAP